MESFGCLALRVQNGPMMSLRPGLHGKGIQLRLQCLDESHQFCDGLCQKLHNVGLSFKKAGGRGTRDELQ